MMHLGKDEIESFLAGRSSREDRDRLMKHLLTRCEGCLRRFMRLAEPLLEEEPWNHVEEVREDAYDAAIARAGAAARQFTLGRRKESEPLSEALLRQSFEERYRDPEKMLLLAQDAARAAEATPPETYQPSPGFVMDLRARALAELGNACRINDRFPEAERAFSRAHACLEVGTGDALLEARVLDLEASLLSDQGRFGDAVSMLNQVHGLYREAGDICLAGRALIKKGINTHYQGFPEKAVQILETGLGLVSPSGDSQLCATGNEALLHALVDAGEYGRASRMILSSGLREAFAEEPLNLLRLRWVEGKIHAGLGRIQQAERIFSWVREEFSLLGRHYDAALLSLELAALWLQQDRAAEVHALAEETYETFERLEVHREARHALDFVREACRRQRATVPMIRSVRSFMEQLTRNPGLRFEAARYAG
jgi:Tetratricopeptide repeat